MTYILIAEDDKFLSSAYRVKFSKEGWKVVIASDGQEALDIIKKDPPHLLILDLVMPNIDGFDVLEELSKAGLTAKIPVIVASNLGQKEDIDRSRQLGAVDFVVKSEMSLTEIVAKVKQILKLK